MNHGNLTFIYFNMNKYHMKKDRVLPKYCATQKLLYGKHFKRIPVYMWYNQKYK